MEFEAYTSGVLRKIVVDTGIAIPVGQLIAVITDPDEPLPDHIETAIPVTSGSDIPKSAGNAAVQPAAPPTVAPAGEVRASPIARRLAKEMGIDLVVVTGSGPGGRIVEQDILSYQEQTPLVPQAETAAPDPALASENVDLSRMRQTIAKVTSDSKRDAPHFYVTSDVNMTKAMALEIAPDVRVNCICPGYVDTDMIRLSVKRKPDPEAAWQKMIDYAPLKRITTPAEIAFGALYLTSQEAQFVTGVALPIDGGTTAGH